MRGGFAVVMTLWLCSWSVPHLGASLQPMLLTTSTKKIENMNGSVAHLLQGMLK